MHERVRQIVKVVRVTGVSEPTEAVPIQVDGQWLVADDQHVDSQIELLATDEERVEDIPLHNIGFSLWRLGLPSELVFPLRDLLEFVEQENAATLTLTDWLHYPHTASSLELLDEDAVLAWQVVGRREEVIRVGLLDLALAVQHLLMALKILDHEILPRELIVVTEMIDLLVSLQMVMIQDVVDLITLHPEDVPIIALCFLVALLAEGVEHTVPEGGLELDVGRVLGVILFLDVLAEVFRHFFLTI